MITRRQTIAGAAFTALASPLLARNSPMAAPGLLIINSKVTTLDRANPQASAIATRDGRFLAVGTEAEVRAAAGTQAIVIDAQGPARYPRADREPHARHPWRAEL